MGAVARHLCSLTASTPAAFYALVNLLASLAFYSLDQPFLYEHPASAANPDKLLSQIPAKYRPVYAQLLTGPDERDAALNLVNLWTI